MYLKFFFKSKILFLEHFSTSHVFLNELLILKFHVVRNSGYLFFLNLKNFLVNSFLSCLRDKIAKH